MRWAAVGLALLVALGWGFGQRRARQRFELQVENAHQAAFYKLVGAVEALEEELRLVEAAGGERAWREGLTAARERARAAGEGAAGLPLPAQPLERSGAFLARAASTADGLLQQQPLPNAAGRTIVAELRQQAAYLRDELLGLVQLTGSGRLRWAEAAAAAAPDGDGGGLTPINRALQSMEDGWAAGEATAVGPLPVPAPPEAERCARSFLQRAFGDISAPAALERDTTGGLAYFSAVTPAGTQARLAVDGGCRVPYMLAFRPLNAIRLQRSEAESAALAAARRLDLGDLRPAEYDATDGVAVVRLAPVVGGRVDVNHVLSLRIALDNGDLLGLACFPHPHRGS